MAERPGELEIQIDSKGKVTVRTKGIKGEACLDWADLMVQILGQEKSRELTSEFYEIGSAQVKQRIDVKNRLR